jgi:hypothetical protein
MAAQGGQDAALSRAQAGFRWATSLFVDELRAMNERIVTVIIGGSHAGSVVSLGRAAERHLRSGGNVYAD